MKTYNSNIKTVALIPLRGGSKSIPRKNIMELGGKPLCFWVIDAALASSLIDEVYVSTEDKEIKNLVVSSRPEVCVIDRPMEYATDEASTEAVMMHFADAVNFDTLVTIQATSPMTQSSDLDRAIKFFTSNNFDSLLTATLSKRFYWSRDASPLNYNYKDRPRRQDFDGTYVENGAFYITKRKIICEDSNRLGGNIGIYEMSAQHEVELDEINDIQAILSKLNGS